MQIKDTCKLNFKKTNNTSNINMLVKTITPEDKQKFKEVFSSPHPLFMIVINNEKIELTSLDNLIIGKTATIHCSNPALKDNFELPENYKQAGYTFRNDYVLNPFGDKICLGCKYYKD